MGRNWPQVRLETDGIGFCRTDYVTPNQRHNDQSAQVLEQRRQVYEAARQLNKRQKDRSAA